MERPGQALKFSILLVASSLTASLAIASEVEEAREGSLRASLLGNLEWRNIGPGMTSGRIAHIAVVEDDTRIIYAATATGGLWKTVNNGTTWKPVFEKEGTLGAVAVALSGWAPVRISTPGATLDGLEETEARHIVRWFPAEREPYRWAPWRWHAPTRTSSGWHR